MTQEPQHSEIGPSSADRWMNCPGSVALSRQVQGDDGTSEYAAQGSVAHDLAEALTSGKVTEMDLMARVGETVEKDGYEIEIDEEMVMAVSFYANVIAEDVKHLKAIDRPAQVFEYTEMRVKLATVDADLWGKADKIVFRKGHKLIVYDFKYGQGKVVEAEKNNQMTLYGLGAMETVAGEAFDEIELVIIQPRAGGVRRWLVDRAWLAQFKVNLAAAVMATKMPNAILRAGSWCRWCRARAGCPEVDKTIQAEAHVDFSMAPAMPSSEEAARIVEILTPAQLARRLDFEDLVKTHFGALRQRAQWLLESGVAVPGYKLVEGRSTRKWADGTGQAAVATFIGGYGDKVYAPKKILSVAQMETLVGKKNIPPSLIVKPEGAKKVAPDNDPREATQPQAQEDFLPTTPVTVEMPQGAVLPSEGLVGTVVEDEVVDPLFGAAPAPVKKMPFWP